MSKKISSLTSGNIALAIFNFAWPVFLSSIFSELYNVTNSMIVGNYISLKALSAVSACTWICNIFNYAFFGLGMGAGIIVAKYYGAKDEKNLKRSLDSAMVFAIVVGVSITILAQLFLPQLMRISNIGPDIYADARSYLRVYFLGCTAVLTYQMCFFILRSFGDTRHQLYFSIIGSISNVILGVIFVRFMHMDVIGTSLATIISQFIMDVLVIRLLINYDEVSFDFNNIDFSFDTVKNICMLGIPAAFQNLLIALSSMMVQSYVNEFPNAVIAGIGVGEKITNWAQMFSVAVSSATMSLVAQNIGAKNYERVKDSVKESLKISSFFTLLSILLIFMAAPFLVSRFNSDIETISIGTRLIRYSIFGIFFVNLSHVFNAACRGAGNVRIPMYIAIIGQVLTKFFFVYFGLKINHDVHVLFFATATGYTCAGLLATLYFFTSRWVKNNHLR